MKEDSMNWRTKYLWAGILGVTAIIVGLVGLVFDENFVACAAGFFIFGSAGFITYLVSLFFQPQTPSVQSSNQPASAPMATVSTPIPIRCPNCAAILEDKPTKKRKCPQCEKYIYVRDGELYTEEQAEIYDWLKKLSYLDIDMEAFNHQRQELTQNFGFKAPVSDTIWSILNAQILVSDRQRQIQIYRTMADLLRSEGRNASDILAKAAELTLLDYQKQGAKFVRIQTYNDEFVCNECRALHHTVLPIGRAIEELPIPTACTNKNGCRCYYVVTG